MYYDIFVLMLRIRCTALRIASRVKSSILVPLQCRVASSTRTHSIRMVGQTASSHYVRSCVRNGPAH
jgi:hypothetical protein